MSLLPPTRKARSQSRPFSDRPAAYRSFENFESGEVKPRRPISSNTIFAIRVLISAIASSALEEQNTEGQSSFRASSETTLTELRYTSRRPMPWRNLVFLFLGDFCGDPKLPWCDADDPLEVKTELALIRETGTYRDFCQTDASLSTQELLRPFDAAIN